MQADKDKLVHVRLECELTELLCNVDPSYQSMITMKKNKPVIYAELDNNRNLPKVECLGLVIAMSATKCN